MVMIPYGCQSISQSDIDAVVEVLQSDWLTQGPKVEAFESALSSVVKASHVSVVSSATAGLHLACLALDVGPGDWVWTSPNSFVASSNAALYCGANVDFVDIDAQTYNMCVYALEKKLKRASEQGLLPKVIIPVHFAGQPCDMQRIHQLANQYGIKVIEDAAHAIGGRYQGQPVGACQYADICVFSFHPVKLMTTGEGGAVTTQSQALHEKIQALRSHGVTRNVEDFKNVPDGGWVYEQQALGYNYRITDFQCALGLSQLDQLDSWIAYRNTLVGHYTTGLKDLPVVLPFQLPEVASAWHLYVILLPNAAVRRRVYDAMRARQIGVQVHYMPIHTQPYYQKLGFAWGDFPQAEAYYQRTLSLPLHAKLTGPQQCTVIDALRAVLVEEGVCEES